MRTRMRMCCEQFGRTLKVKRGAEILDYCLRTRQRGEGPGRHPYDMDLSVLSILLLSSARFLPRKSIRNGCRRRFHPRSTGSRQDQGKSGGHGQGSAPGTILSLRAQQGESKATQREPALSSKTVTFLMVT
jgi:hypothetical protein